MEESTGTNRARRRAGIALLAFALVLLTLLAYRRAPGTEFIGDDFWRISMNEALLKQGFAKSVAEILPDRPLLVMTILLNYSLGGLDPWGYKVFSLALHIGVGLAFFALLLRLQRIHFATEEPLLPALFAALFLVHPVNSQAVLSSIQRGVILASIGGVGCLFFFLEYLASRRRAFFLLALLCYTLGVLSKSLIVSVPLIMLLYLRVNGRPIRRHLRAFLPLLLITALPLIPYQLWGVNRQEGPEVLPWYDYLLVQARVVWTYLRLDVAPIGLRFWYEVDRDPGLLKNLTWLALLGHGALLAAATLLVRRRRELAGFAIFALYLAFLPESGLFAIYHLAFEHRAYFPLLFFLLALFALARPLAGAARKTAVVALPVVLVFSLLTDARIREVATFEQWALDAYRKQTHDRTSNVMLLNALLCAGSNTLGARMSRAMAAEDPSYRLYPLFARVFSFPDAVPAAQRETVALVSRALLDRPSFQVWDDLTTRNLLAFFTNHAARFAPDPLAYQKLLEPVLRSQLPLFLENPEFFGAFIELHQATLARLMGHAEGLMAAGAISEEEFAGYLAALGEWSLYYPQSDAELDARFERLRRAYPERAALIEDSRRLFRDLRLRP